jgi:hypothetical protein
MCGAETFLFINEKSRISRALRGGSEPLVRIEVPTGTRNQCSGFLKSKALRDTWMSRTFSEDPQLRKGDDATEASHVTD